jgi:hypothetical protein
MLDTHFENVIEWGKHYEAEELRKQDEKGLSELLYSVLAKTYARHIVPDLESILLSEARKNAYTDSCKKFHQFCENAGMDGIRCLPARVGIVAGFLYEELKAGASYSQIKKHVEAISYFHKLNESYDPTEDELIKAIMRAANPKGRLSDNENEN